LWLLSDLDLYGATGDFFICLSADYWSIFLVDNAVTANDNFFIYLSADYWSVFLLNLRRTLRVRRLSDNRRLTPGNDNLLLRFRLFILNNKLTLTSGGSLDLGFLINNNRLTLVDARDLLVGFVDLLVIFANDFSVLLVTNPRRFASRENKFSIFFNLL